MKNPIRFAGLENPQPNSADRETGFSLVEFMLSSLVLLVIAASSFGVLTQTERTADTQAEVQSVTNNARVAMEALTRIIQQAGNDPLGAGIEGINVVSSSELRVRSDITGSAVDRGDPDGDTSDSGEDITIRYNSPARTIELVYGAAAQPIACNISAFSMQYYNRLGAQTTTGDDVVRVRIALTAASQLPDPQTGQTFSMQLRSDVQIAGRQ